MANYLFKVPTGVVIFLINIPILFLGYKKLGKRMILISLYAIAITSIVVDFTTEIGLCLTEVPLLAALFGGALIGFGIGIIFRNGGTTGGTDIVVRLVKLKYRHIKTGVIFMMTDIIIVSISALVFKDIDTALYAGISIMVSSLVMNKALYGGDEARLIYIVSEKNNEIADVLLSKVGAGVTYLKGRGAYLGVEKDIIMCVIRIQQLPAVEEEVKEIDENSFMIITSATEIFGEGYKKHGTFY